ncbi:MAG: eCIS core domain-containing protein [Myxococcota bacterium]
MSTPIAPQQTQTQVEQRQEEPTQKRGMGGSAAVQLKAQLGGKAYAEQAAILAPPGPWATQGATTDALQAKGPMDGTDAVHAAAAHGAQGGGGALPHAGAIQAAFGGHDVSGISAHVGGRAAEANAAMGASAYASGNDVAFASQPDLHTAAHEAAHIVQQRGGVSLEGGVGKVGDSYEAHADSVADAVVAGKSAEPLLDKMAGGSKGAGVQQKAVQQKATQQDAVQQAGGGAAPAVDPVVQGYLDDPTSHPRYGDFAAKSRATTIPASVWGRAWASAVRAVHDPVVAARAGHFESVANLLRPHLMPPVTGKVSFYSGYGARPEAVKRGCSILEEAPGAAVFDALDLTSAFASWSDVRPLWVTLSTTFAANIQRTVHAYLSYWNAGSIYVGDEMPILRDAGIRRQHHPVAPKMSGTTAVDHTVLDASGNLTDDDATMGEAACRTALDAWAAKSPAAQDREWATFRGIGGGGGGTP